MKMGESIEYYIPSKSCKNIHNFFFYLYTRLKCRSELLCYALKKYHSLIHALEQYFYHYLLSHVTSLCM